MLSHGLWASLVVAEGAFEKRYKLYEGGEAREVILTLVDSSQKGGEGMAPDQASAARPGGWRVTMAYAVAPDKVIFDNTYATEKTARDVMTDLSRAAAEVEVLVRQEKFTEAEEATKGFLEKMQANTATPPIETAG